MSGEMTSGQMAWAWFFVGIIFLVIEVMTPGLLFIFFGLAAVVVAVLVALVPAVPPAWQIVIFSVLSVVSLALMRRVFKKIFSGNKSSISETGLDDDFVGHRAVVTDIIDGQIPGRVDFNGTSWEAIAADKIVSGVMVEIVAKNNLTLTVRAIVSDNNTP